MHSAKTRAWDACVGQAGRATLRLDLLKLVAECLLALSPWPVVDGRNQTEQTTEVRNTSIEMHRAVRSSPWPQMDCEEGGAQQIQPFMCVWHTKASLHSICHTRHMQALQILLRLSRLVLCAVLCPLWWRGRFASSSIINVLLHSVDSVWSAQCWCCHLCLVLAAVWLVYAEQRGALPTLQVDLQAARWALPTPCPLHITRRIPQPLTAGKRINATSTSAHHAKDSVIYIRHCNWFCKHDCMRTFSKRMTVLSSCKP